MKRWTEKLAFCVVILIFLIPISIVQNRIDGDQIRVAFLRWIDNQEAYKKQVFQRIIGEDDERSSEELALFERVEQVGASLAPDFRDLPVNAKWRVIQKPEFQPQYMQFIQLAKQSKISLTGEEIEWANPDVSANVGALVLGFRKLVADMLWLKVDEYWHMGLVQRMMPMMETVVALDPHFIEAYALGAWHLAYNVTLLFHSADEKAKYIDQGIRLLESGIKTNPRSSKLYAELGYTIYFRKLSDWEKAAYYLREATKYEHDPWVERIYATALERTKQEEKALAIIEDYNRRFPEHISHRLALIRLRRKQEARRAEAEGEVEKALKIWKFLKDDDPTDIVAPKEVLRLQNILGKESFASS